MNHIEIKPGAMLIEYIRNLDDSADFPERVLSVKRGENGNLKRNDIEWIKQKITQVPADYPLHKMLRCCDILLPTLPAPPPRNPQLEARCLRLRKEQEQKEYDAMVNRIAPPKERKPDNLAAELREVNRQLIQVFQFVLSTGSAFVFGFWGVDWAAGPFDFGSRSLIGVFCALIVAIAEIYFLIKIIGVSDNFIDGVKNKKICSKDE
ncbi:transmembrane protein 199-like [Artemia franciscana]|uniref:transmembrane protein 199-like n=1 Tax=Artemia franciscana TaxID=6661 RepID=UPI0032DB06B1